MVVGPLSLASVAASPPPAELHIDPVVAVVTFLGTLAICAVVWKIAPRRIWVAYTAIVVVYGLAIFVRGQTGFMTDRSGIAAFGGILVGMMGAAGVTYWALRLTTQYRNPHDTP